MNRFRSLILGAALVVSAAMVTAGVAMAHGDVAATEGAGTEDNRVGDVAVAPAGVVKIAQREAAYIGTVEGTTAEWGLATMQEGVAVLDTDAREVPKPLEKEYYFVVLRGEFADEHAVLDGQPVPKGTFAVVTIDAETMEEVGFSLRDSAPQALESATWLQTLCLE